MFDDEEMVRVEEEPPRLGVPGGMICWTDGGDGEKRRLEADGV